MMDWASDEDIPPPPEDGEDPGYSNGHSKPKPPPLRRAVDYVGDIVIESTLEKVPLGFPQIDKRLGGGMAVHTLTVLTAPEGGGKTSMAAQIGTAHAMHSPVLYYCAELTPAQLAARVVAQRTGLSWQAIRNLELDAEKMTRELDGLHLYLLPRSRTPVGEIKACVADLVTLGKGTVLCIVDYVQLLADVGENARGATAKVIRELQAMTETMKVATLGLAQGSRASARAMRSGDGDTADYAGVAAETAEFERAAVNSVVLIGSRPDDSIEWDMTAVVTKSRYGIPGRVGLHFHGPSGRWSELDGVPVSDVEKERGDAVVAEVAAHAKGGCCDQQALSGSALTRKPHKVPGTKGVVLATVRRLDREGRIRNEGGALLPVRER